MYVNIDYLQSSYVKRKKQYKITINRNHDFISYSQSSKICSAIPLFHLLGICACDFDFTTGNNLSYSFLDSNRIFSFGGIYGLTDFLLSGHLKLDLYSETTRSTRGCMKCTTLLSLGPFTKSKAGSKYFWRASSSDMQHKQFSDSRCGQ